jgi:predicted O-methyltransferase YrrM
VRLLLDRQISDSRPYVGTFWPIARPKRREGIVSDRLTDQERQLRSQQILEYTPDRVGQAAGARTIAVPSAWASLEYILPDILDRFGVGSGRCLEFGVEFGYSTVALSNYFDQVTGVDIFTGDIHTAFQGDHFAETSATLSQFENIELVRADYRDWINADQSTYDLIHVDIVHTYEDTYACGLWSAQHAPCVLFHDTESFPAVRNAVMDVAAAVNRRFHNFPHQFGLGIVA